MVDAQVQSLPLTPSYSCNSGYLDRAPLYAVFRAAQILLTNIHEDAEKLVDSPLSPPEMPGCRRRFPYVESLSRVPSENGRIQFQISKSLSDTAAARLLYLADTSGAEGTILVKFTKKYGMDLHLFCASMGFAPKLLAFERLPGGWFGVAMEYLKDATHVIDHDEGEKWLEEMRNITKSFHTEGFVHGDLRLPNFIIKEEKLYLVDFDWGGKEGETTFPDVRLRSDLRNGRGDIFIKKSHDEKVLANTIKEIEEKFDWKLKGV